MSSKAGKNFILISVGIAAVILGVTLTLVWWQYLVVIFKGLIGFILALVGLLVIYSAKK